MLLCSSQNPNFHSSSFLLSHQNQPPFLHSSRTALDTGQRMIINGCGMISKTYNPISCHASWPRPASLPAKAALTNVTALFRPSEGLKLHYPTGFLLSSHLSASSTPLLGGEHGGLSHTIPALPKRRARSIVPRAAKDVPYTFRFPPMMKKPQFWWRTLACLPYLMPLHETWMYAETAYHLHPFLEDLEFLTYPFLRSIGRLPPWFFMAYFFVAYLGVVRRKEWPHFFRFHVVMGMLLEISLQVIGTISRWMPKAVYWGKFGMHFWTAVAFGFLFTVLECIRCALAGMYADVPFVCDAAYIQIPYD